MRQLESLNPEHVERKAEAEAMRNIIYPRAVLNRVALRLENASLNPGLRLVFDRWIETNVVPLLVSGPPIRRALENFISEAYYDTKKAIEESKDRKVATTHAHILPATHIPLIPPRYLLTTRRSIATVTCEWNTIAGILRVSDKPMLKDKILRCWANRHDLTRPPPTTSQDMTQPEEEIVPVIRIRRTQDEDRLAQLNDPRHAELLQPIEQLCRGLNETVPKPRNFPFRIELHPSVFLQVIPEEDGDQVKLSLAPLERLCRRIGLVFPSPNKAIWDCVHAVERGKPPLEQVRQVRNDAIEALINLAAQNFQLFYDTIMRMP